VNGFKRVSLALLLTGVITGAVLAQVSSQQPTSRKECAVCHLEWVDAFSQPGAITLIEPPTRIMASESETCLGCHDASVVDSRLRVWLEHGHKTGVVPPASMTVPALLPLQDGKLACRTCHTAHGAKGMGSADLASAVFLRVPNETSQLCKMCHTDKVGGPALGSHPIGGMPWPIPQELIDAGSKARPGDRSISCQVCHTPHGSEREHLLVMGVTSNELCLTCHEKLRPRMWRKRQGVHPDRPVVHSPEQMAAVKRMGTRLGSEDRLICLSCHKIHHGQNGRFMIAMPLEGSTFCLQCHPGKQSTLGTVHDLRQSAPQVQNLLGMTPEQSGPCGSCHMFHNLAIRPNQTDADPLGVCTSCHIPGGPAAKTGDLKLTHPINVPVPAMSAEKPLPLFEAPIGEKGSQVMTCTTCHDPHNTSNPKFLRDKPENLCRTCHADVARRIADGPHATLMTKTDNPDAGQHSGTCLACHKIHAWTTDQTLWAVTPAEGQPSSDAICLGCHKDIQWSTAEQGPIKSVMHPRAVVRSNKLPLPLVAAGTGEKADRIGCQTCHNPHAGKDSPMLLRASEQGKKPAGVCFECHENVAFIGQSMHGQRAMKLETDKKRVCGPCHAVHAVEGSTRNKLWAVKLSDQGDTTAERRCLGCHRTGGPAAPPSTIVHHPQEPLTAIDWKDENTGLTQITCLTCHLPHGKNQDIPDQVSLPVLAAAKPMLRSDVAETTCAVCHGFDAARRFLYFHRPEARR